MVVVKKIAEIFGFVTKYVKPDYILYGAGGLIVLVFILALLIGGYAAKFRKAADRVTAYLKSNTGTEQLDAKMEALPKQAAAAWKNFKVSENAAPAVYLTQNACVDAHVRRNAARNYLFLVIITALISFFLNLLVLNGAALGANEIVAPLAVIVLGAIFSVVLGVVQRSRNKKALAAYNGLIACLNAYLPEKEKGPVMELPLGATVHPETFQANEPEDQGNEPEAKAAGQTAVPPAKPYWEPSNGFAPPLSVYDYANPQKEDVVAQIERITASNASKQTMLEVAKLLQAERAKAENKTPEQQRRLNTALATLLRAISTANT